MSDPDKDALVAMIDRAIIDVERSRGSCDAHGPLSRAVVVLLQCQRSQMHQRSVGSVAGAICGTVAGAVTAIVAAILRDYKLS
jgi:hypothetical protein